MTGGPPPVATCNPAAVADDATPTLDGAPARDASLIDIIDALALPLIYRDDDGQRVIANSAAHRLLGLDDATSSPATILAALARIAGPEFDGPPHKGFDVEHDGRLFQIGTRKIDGVIGNGLLWRLEDVTDERRRRAHFVEAKRQALLASVAGGVGHQFNNLLARLICQAEAIQDATSADEVHALAEQVIRTAEDGAETVRRLMTYAGGAVIECQNVDLASLALSWKKSLRTPLVIDAESCSGTVIADHDLLRASFDELHANAVHAGATRLDIHSFSESDDMIILDIVDDGRGMSPEVCTRATDPFFTGEEVGENVGLGLSMVQGAMRQCDGDLEIISHPGKGTTIRLRLARGKGQA